MSNGKVLRYTDPRRFGAAVDQKAGRAQCAGHLGPEPLSDDFNGEYLHQKCAKKKRRLNRG